MHRADFADVDHALEAARHTVAEAELVRECSRDRRRRLALQRRLALGRFPTGAPAAAGDHEPPPQRGEAPLLVPARDVVALDDATEAALRRRLGSRPPG